MKKVFVTTAKVGTSHRLFVHGTGSQPGTRSGRTIAARPPKEIRFNRGLFVANDEVKYRVLDDFDGEQTINQIEWMEQCPENVANGGQAFREHEKWMDKVDAGRLLQANAASMTDEQFLNALHKVESMPEGAGPSADDIQVHVGARDAGARGVTLQDVEPNYGNLEAIQNQLSPVDAKTAATLKRGIVQAD